MKRAILVLSVALTVCSAATASASAPSPEYLKNKYVNALAFPIFAATAYYFFDEAGEAYDHVKDYIREWWYEERSQTTRKPAWLVQAADVVSKKILRRRTRQELWFKELDKQSYYLIGAIGTSIIGWALRTHCPQARTFLFLGDK